MSHVVAAGHRMVGLHSVVERNASRNNTVSTLPRLLLSAQRCMHAGPLAAPPVAAFNSLPLSRRLGRRAGTTGTADPAVTANAGSRTCRLPGETVQLPERLHRRLIVQIGPSLLGSAQQRVGDIRGQVRLGRERRRGGTAGVAALLQELLDGRGGWRGRQVREVRVVHSTRRVRFAMTGRR